MKQLQKIFQRYEDWRRERRIEQYKQDMCEAFNRGDLGSARECQALFSRELEARSADQRQRMLRARSRSCA